MIKIHMKKLITYLFIFVIVALPLIASAATTAERVVCNILNAGKNIVVMVGFAIAIIFLVVGAIKYLTSQGDDEKAKTARKMIVNSLIGIAILVGVYILFSFIQSTITEIGLGGTILHNPCPELGI